MIGAQLGLININEQGKLYGIQLGLVNGGNELRGVQIGLINLVGDMKVSCRMLGFNCC